MMTISLSDAGKRYNRDWIYRHFTYQFESGQSYAITGPNGSGKSTLLQALSGVQLINEGRIEWQIAGKPIDPEKVFSHVSICAPYLDVIEEMTLLEFLAFHEGFKPFLPGLTIPAIISLLGLEKAAKKQIRNYSSGMKQRVKLAQCILSDTAIVLLDEPCTNLDASGISLYHNLISQYGQDRLIVVSSNDETEFKFCQAIINISEYKLIS